MSGTELQVQTLENQHYPYVRNLSKSRIIEYKYFDNCYKHNYIFFNI